VGAEKFDEFGPGVPSLAGADPAPVGIPSMLGGRPGLLPRDIEPGIPGTMPLPYGAPETAVLGCGSELNCSDPDPAPVVE